MVKVKVTTEDGVVMEVEAAPEDLADALDVVVRVAESRGGGGGRQQRPLLRTRLSPGQDPAENTGDDTEDRSLSA